MLNWCYSKYPLGIELLVIYISNECVRRISTGCMYLVFLTNTIGRSESSRPAVACYTAYGSLVHSDEEMCFVDTSCCVC